MARQIKAGYVRGKSGSWYVQLPAANQWGFILCSDDQSWDGGFGAESEWELVPRLKVPKRIRTELGWILEDEGFSS